MFAYYLPFRRTGGVYGMDVKYLKASDLAPPDASWVDEVLAPFDAAAAAARQKAAAPATTGNAIAQSGLQKKELATFCL